jgi:hypothetical protein
MKLRVAISLSLLLAGGLSLAAQDLAGLGSVSLNDGFVTKGRNPNGSLAWIFKGRQAAIRGNLFYVQDDNPDDALPGVELTLFSPDGSKYVLTSPKCEFNKLTKSGSSDQPVRIVGKNLEIKGVGYDFWPDQRRFFIRSKVEMHFTNPSELGKALTKPSADAAKDKPADAAKDKPADAAKDKPADAAKDKPADAAKVPVAVPAGDKPAVPAK